MKKSIINDRIVLEADEGKVITDGKDLYSSKLYLGNGIAEEDLHEISIEEYKEILKQEDVLSEMRDVE